IARPVRLNRQGAQLKRRQTGHYVQCDRTLKRKRLKRNGAVGTAKEDVRASTQANANISGNADIFSSQRSGGQSSGRFEPGPAQPATGTDADVQPYGVEGTRVGFLWDRRVWDEEATHRLVADYDEADIRIDLAIEPTPQRPRLRSLGRGRCGERRC